MKKILLLAVLLTIVSDIFAFTTQGVWRWRKDDGSETTATWSAAQNTAVLVGSRDSILRLRIELYTTSGSGILDNAYLEDSSDAPGATWTKIFVEPGTNAFLLAGSSPNVNDLDATTAQLTGQPNTFVTGKIIVSTDSLPSASLSKKQRTEYEWAIKPTSYMDVNRTYYFRVDAANYVQALPSLLTAGTLAVKLSSFKLSAENKQVKIEWVTASEEFNNKFEIERSSDSRNWKVIGSVFGTGTSSIAHTYLLYDKNPLAGINYYRIRQYDMNGSSSVSEVESIKMSAANNSVVTVLPNPVKDNIKFSLQNFAGGDLVVSVTANNGKVLHAETIKSAQANTTYTLNMSKPSAGVYMLNVNGQGLSEHVKVVVE